MTERELICLGFLENKMELTASMVGKAIYVADPSLGGGSNLSSIGANVLGCLRKRGLVTRSSDLNAWRITVTGREALAQSRQPEAQP